MVGQEDDLVINHSLGVRYAVHHRHQIHRHFGIVYLNIRVGTDQRRECGAVHVHEAVHFATLVAHRNSLIVRLEVRHRDSAVVEIHGEVAIHILARFGFVQESGLHTAVTQLVVYLADFHKEVTPFLVVEREKTAFLSLLRDGQVTKAVRVLAATEITEVRRREKFSFAVRFIRKAFPDENILFVNGVPFAQCLRKGSEQVRELVVTVDVRRILLHRILYFQYGGIFAGLGVQYAHTVRLFRRKIDILKDSLALAACAERIDRYGHADTQCDKGCDNV